MSEIGIGLGSEHFQWGAIATGGGGGGATPADLPGYYLGMDGTSWPVVATVSVSTISPGFHVQAVPGGTLTNLAAGSPQVLVPVNNNIATTALIHEGAWQNLTLWADVPDPNGHRWWSTNWGSPAPDPSMQGVSSVKLNSVLTTGGNDAMSVMYVGCWMSAPNALLWRPLYSGDGNNRWEVSSSATGAHLIRTSHYGPDTYLYVGDMRTDKWFVYGMSWGPGSVKVWIDGVEKGPTDDLSTMTGTIEHSQVQYSSDVYGGSAELHAWHAQHSPENMNTQMQAMAAKYNIAYTFTPYVP